MRPHVPKVRNPFVVLALVRKAGTHGKTPRARRHAEKHALSKRLEDQ